MRFIVKDWAGNVMDWGTFATLEDVWSEIMTREPNEEDQGEYYAEAI